MPNSYYDNQDAGQRFLAGETARGSDVDAKFDSVEAGFDLLPAADEIKTGATNYVTDSGTANNYVLTSTQSYTAYTTGQQVRFIATHANTGGAVINLDGLGNKSVLRQDGSALRSGDIPAEAMVTATYNGTAFLLDTSTSKMVADAEQAVVDAQTEVANAAAQATLATTAKTAAETAEANAAASDTAAATKVTYAEEWANKAEDSLVSVAAGGDGSTEYSSKHHALKAAASAAAAAASSGIPSIAGNASKYLSVNSGETAAEWTSISAVSSIEVLTSGTSYTVPAGVTQIKVLMCGGGGGGGTNSAGGAGGALLKYMTVTPGSSITYAVGAAGAALSTGGTTTFDTLTCTGGQGASNDTDYGAAGGAASGGDVNINGGGGYSAYAGNYHTEGGTPGFGLGIGATRGRIASDAVPASGYGSGGAAGNAAMPGVIIITYIG